MTDKCRCCLIDCAFLEISQYHNFDDQIQLDALASADEFEEKSYRNVFEEYAGFKVLPGEPENVCENCVKLLLDGWRFWKLLRKTQNVLQETLINEENEATADVAAQEKEERQLAEETKDILAYLADDLNISGECKNIDTLPPLSLDLDLDALIDGHSVSLNLDSSPNKHICPFSPNKAYKYIDMHLSRKHRDLKIIQCTTMGCRRKFYTPEMLSEHLQKDCGRRPNVIRHENKMNFTCKFCGRIFDTYQKVRSHENAHRTRIKSAKEGPRYKCDICQKLFMEKKNVRLHIESVHLQLQKLQCIECDLKFLSYSGYRYHNNTVHKKDRETFKCSYCSYITKVRFLLTRHLKRHENQDGLIGPLKKSRTSAYHECPICLKTIKTHLFQKHLKKMHENSNKIVFCKMPSKKIN